MPNMILKESGNIWNLPTVRDPIFRIGFPRTVMFTINDKDPNDPYARLFSDDVVCAVNDLTLPRYGLGNYQKPSPHKPPTPEEARVLADLSRAGTHLKGFCRTNLFKRLESSGHAFILSVERHILRNFIYLHAIEKELPLPIGTQDIGLLDTWANDLDSELWEPADDIDNNSEADDPSGPLMPAFTENDFRQRAAEAYNTYFAHFRRRFKWLRPELFDDVLRTDLKNDAAALMAVLNRSGAWDAERDAKLQALVTLLSRHHPREKVLVFTQFADTVDYLEMQLKKRGMSFMAGVTGDTVDPTQMAYRFSPVSNDRRKQIQPEDELRIIVATDVLSEGQNLQDCAIIVNYDLPWAIIRLIQRAGRVDRIGQQADTILCYSFLPADGVERIIRLRARVRQRLHGKCRGCRCRRDFF